ncbi:unnamed protein product [Rhodiola kirilowii]
MRIPLITDKPWKFICLRLWICRFSASSHTGHRCEFHNVVQKA